MPGLHDMHTHLAYFLPSPDHRHDLDVFHLGGMAIARAERMLMNGFTTIRDLGGPAKFAQKIIDNGSAPGPRIYPSEAWVTQTSGHGDKRSLNDQHPNMNQGAYHQFERYWSFIADGPTEVRRGVRESLRRGATQIKLHTGGGVTSPFDPLHTVQFTPEEIRAAVEAAEGWKTYCTTHAFIDEAVRIAIDNGVKCIEHYAMITEDTVKLMAEKKIWAVTNMESVMGLPPEEYKKIMPGDQFAKLMDVLEKFNKAVSYMAKHNKEHMAYGTDIVNDWKLFPEWEATAQNAEFEHLAKFLDPVDVLKVATSNSARLAKLCGPNDPYPHPSGVIEEGAYADMILVDGNPIEDILLMTMPDKNFPLIMKDGVIYKNTLK